MPFSCKSKISSPFPINVLGAVEHSLPFCLQSSPKKRGLIESKRAA